MVFSHCPINDSSGYLKKTVYLERVTESQKVQLSIHDRLSTVCNAISASTILKNKLDNISLRVFIWDVGWARDTYSVIPSPYFIGCSDS